MKNILEEIQDWLNTTDDALILKILKTEIKKKIKKIWDKETKDRGKRANIHITRVPKEKTKAIRQTKYQ